MVKLLKGNEGYDEKEDSNYSQRPNVANSG